ncbi:unnamed protein product [Mycena citricolor]|uniref:Uncharacterized protein n=1 Tax=Mycena citricolor TaxID=2018698 RepID=A0AAD2JWE8_9AGAR|nr:unnamed protein product [Mycena citricolor]
MTSSCHSSNYREDVILERDHEPSISASPLPTSVSGPMDTPFFRLRYGALRAVTYTTSNRLKGLWTNPWRGISKQAGSRTALCAKSHNSFSLSPRSSS